MAKTIPQLTDATTVNAADELIIQQGGITKRATGAELAKGLNTINGMVNVKDFGAVGDGVADDTAAIQAALNTGSKLVYFPAGTYLATSVSLPSNIILSGCGYASVLQTSTNAFFVNAESQNNIGITKLRFVGDSATLGGKASQSLVVLRGCTQCSVTECYFEGGARGINIGNVQGLSPIVRSSNIIITGNFFTNIADCAIFTIRAKAVTISHNIIDGVGNGGTSNFAQGINIDDGSATDGLLALEAEQIIVYGNIIQNLTGDTASYGITVTGTKNTVISSNILYNIGATGVQGMTGIRLSNGGLSPDLENNNITITGNHLTNIADDGIRLERSNACHISGNHINNWGSNTGSSSTAAAIQIGSLSARCSATNNHCQAGATSGIGVYVLSSCSNTMVFGNAIDPNGNSITPLNLSGTNTITMVSKGGALAVADYGFPLQCQSSTGSNNLATSGTEFLVFQGVHAPNATESLAKAFFVDYSIVIRRFRVLLNTAPSAGQSRSFTIRRAEIDTGATVTIADTETQATFVGDVSVTSGNFLTVSSTVSGTPSASPVVFLVEYVRRDPN
jgi:parallel beta-helix repeat protein